jgi:hypothetical protein
MEKYMLVNRADHKMSDLGSQNTRRIENADHQENLSFQQMTRHGDIEIPCIKHTI